MTITKAATIMLTTYGTTTSDFETDLRKIDEEFPGLCRLQLEEVWFQWNEISDQNHH